MDLEVHRDFWYAPNDKCFFETCHVRCGAAWASIMTTLISLTGILYTIYHRHQTGSLTKIDAVYEHYPLLIAFSVLLITSLIALGANLSKRKMLYMPHLVWSLFAHITFMYSTVWFLVAMIRHMVVKEPIPYFEKIWVIGLAIAQPTLIYLLDVIYRDYKYLNRQEKL
ncbi:unnamed protein product [Bursaphelenchus okinawaensis]|uniref:Uncharacterized protein n=1 Tax=Bursaphelenchus okinawaensis TaxID=465554 RepID=A0A811LHD2_9BILA|nr:unnamed protein product [Bursaphelenchus okinawaensis]CAG9123832.1 unnamed protein product [Bursaphelenchus okinawaensis]